MPWVRRRFKQHKVYVEVDDAGALFVRNGRVAIKYQPDDTTTYAVHPRRIDPLEPQPLIAPVRPTAPDARDPEGAIVAYTDGSCLGNPGPAGWGAYLRAGSHSRDLSGYLGEATNNIAELWAIKGALQAIKDRRRRILLYSDSRYARGVLALGWKVKANGELIAEIRALISELPRLELRWVRSHAGHVENEWVDYLARRAMSEGRHTPHPS
ncbi:MAG: ribonuclease H [Planctomycetota bacterium]